MNLMKRTTISKKVPAIMHYTNRDPITFNVQRLDFGIHSQKRMRNKYLHLDPFSLLFLLAKLELIFRYLNLRPQIMFIILIVVDDGQRAADGWGPFAPFKQK